MDLFEAADAKAKRDAAMMSVATHADEDLPGWTASAEAWLRKYARDHRRFISEECTQAAYLSGEVKQPVDPRAWGLVFKRVAKSEEITKDGYGISKRRNCSPTPLWISNVYGRDS